MPDTPAPSVNPAATQPVEQPALQKQQKARKDKEAKTAGAAPPALSGPQRAMNKLGLRRDIDLALHLPMRYEDETRLVPISSLRDGSVGQVQGIVRECRVETKTRRQLLVRVADASGEVLLRFLNFYPSNQDPGRRQPGTGARRRAGGLHRPRDGAPDLQGGDG